MLSTFHIFCIMFVGGMVVTFLVGFNIIFGVIGIICVGCSPVCLLLPPLSKAERYDTYKSLPDARHIHKLNLQKKEYGFHI